MMKLLGFLLILLSPLCMGLPWVRLGGAKSTVAKLCFAYVVGYFMRVALFHAVALPMTLLGKRFSTMADVFTVLLVAACAISVWVGGNVFSPKEQRSKTTVYGKIYLFAFIGLLVVQLYLTITMDPTIMTHDDAGYVPYSGDALATDYMFITYPVTGAFMDFNFRIMQSSLLFPAYIVRVTGMKLTTVERTLSYALNLIIAYGCYFYMAEDLYAKREDRYIFLVLLAIIYIFGYHSHYSMTFRLLGPNSQGKAVLAVIMVPLLFVLLRKRMAARYDWKFGLLLLLLSISACSLSLMGAAYVPIIVTALTVLSMFNRKRQWERMLYVVWAGAIPFAYAITYLLSRNYI